MLARIPTDGGKRVLPQFVQTGMAPLPAVEGGTTFSMCLSMTTPVTPMSKPSPMSKGPPLLPSWSGL